MRGPVGVGIIGSQFISTIHADALNRCAHARIVAAASPTKQHVREFAAKFNIPRTFTDYRRVLELPEIEMIVVGAPNQLHCQIALDAAAAGKHIVIETPLCLNLAEADRMIAACARAGVKLMYAEELCFAPKYVRLKQLLDSGALGQPTLVKQSEKHDGPHAAHFWDVSRSGGGVTMDMGCHAIEFFRWMLGRPKIKSVYAQMNTQVHGGKTRGDDNAILILEFENGAVGLAEESWTKLGGMDDRAEVHGSKGVAYADLLHGNSIQTYSAEVTITRWKRPARRRGGALPFTRKPGITVSTRRWRILSIACGWASSRWLLGRMAAVFWKPFSPRTNRPGPGRKSNFLSSPPQRDRMIYGGRGASNQIIDLTNNKNKTHYERFERNFPGQTAT